MHKRLLDHLTTAVMMVDAELRIRYLNPAAEILLFASAQRSVGQRLPDCFFDDEDSSAALYRCIEEGHPFTRREAKLAIAPGQEIVADYSVVQLSDPGQPISLLVELQPLDRMLRIGREEALVHAHQATRALVRGVAHELKNPLGGFAVRRSCLSGRCLMPTWPSTPASSLMRRIGCGRWQIACWGRAGCRISGR